MIVRVDWQGEQILARHKTVNHYTSLSRAKLVSLISATLLYATAPLGFQASALANSPDAPTTLPDSRPIAGIGYTPFHPDRTPHYGPGPDPDGIARDVERMGQVARSIRLYASTDGSAPALDHAAERGMTVTLGAWIARDEAVNEREISTLIDHVNGRDLVTRLMVGNEVILRADQTTASLIAMINRVREETGKPVSTAEPWHIWHEHPELAEAVDFLAVHLLPYWDGVPVEEAVPYWRRRVADLKARYPDKPILIAEIGWPSAGDRKGGSDPDPDHQRRFIRETLAALHEDGLDYYLLEGFDQPWKAGDEGIVGGHWGLWDAQGAVKVPLP